MLILTRKTGEEIIIGNNVKICIMGVKGDKVSVGITAPKEISVHRKEVYDAIYHGPPNDQTNE